MLISVVLRLSPIALASGGFAGEAEDVQTGERASFRDVDELTRFCSRLIAGAVPGPRRALLDLPVTSSSLRELP